MMMNENQVVCKFNDLVEAAKTLDMEFSCDALSDFTLSKVGLAMPLTVKRFSSLEDAELFLEGYRECAKS